MGGRDSRVNMVRLHLIMTWVWVGLSLPTILWWRDSILWVLLMSIWANASTHWGAWQAARAERAQLAAGPTSTPEGEGPD